MEPQRARLSEVALAISAFKSDEAVLSLLRSVFASGASDFGAVIVVDSLGSGAIPGAAQKNGWNVRYINADHNLGSAGNLDVRLRTAVETGLRWCYAVNHDGVVDQETAQALLRRGNSGPRIGAVYPQLVFENAQGRIDAARGRFSLYGFLERAEISVAPTTAVAWSSSNCALYNLDAIRDGVRVWPDLWMGWEDLALGWELQKKGWIQLRCNDVPVIDSYEFSPRRFLGVRTFLSEKPSWYNYYQLRNLLLISQRSRGEAVGLSSVAGRALIDLALIALYRDRKLERLKLLFNGLRDGLHQRSGKGPLP